MPPAVAWSLSEVPERSKTVTSLGSLPSSSDSAMLSCIQLRRPLGKVVSPKLRLKPRHKVALCRPLDEAELPKLSSDLSPKFKLCRPQDSTP